MHMISKKVLSDADMDTLTKSCSPTIVITAKGEVQTHEEATVAKRSQQDSGEERVTAKSRPMMNLIAKTPSFVSSSTSVSPVKRHYGSQDPWRSIAGEDRSGRPDKGTDLSEASDHHYHEQFLESFSSTSYSKLDDDRAWSSQEWKTETTTYDRSRRPDKTCWRMVRKVRPDHEEILLDGTAQSVRNEETLRDRSGRPDSINSQEVVRPQNFVMGDDETELELSVESRSFVNRVNDQVRERQKRISNVAGDVKSISPIQEISMQYGYNENDNNNMSDETKCETNYSINNKWNNMRNKHITKHDTNDDVDLDNCVVHTVR